MAVSNSWEKSFKKQEKLREDTNGILGKAFKKLGKLRENMSGILGKII